jgi:hypothetical protein
MDCLQRTTGYALFETPHKAFILGQSSSFSIDNDYIRRGDFSELKTPSGYSTMTTPPINFQSSLALLWFKPLVKTNPGTMISDQAKTVHRAKTKPSTRTN